MLSGELVLPKLYKFERNQYSKCYKSQKIDSKLQA